MLLVLPADHLNYRGGELWQRLVALVESVAPTNIGREAVMVRCIVTIRFSF